jgi:hypothetical protein
MLGLIIAGSFLQPLSADDAYWQALRSRMEAQDALRICASVRASYMIRQRDTAEALARAAIALCNEERERFRSATHASMMWRPERVRTSEAEDWVTTTEREIHEFVATLIIGVRSGQVPPPPE